MGQLTFPQMLCGTAVPTARSLPLKSRGSPGLLLHRGNTVASTASFIQQTLLAIYHLGVFISILRDLQCIFSAYITSEKAFGPNYIIKDKTEGLLALLPLFWKNSSRLIESTWFTAKLNGGNHLTDILDDSRRKRHLLLVLLSSDCHNPFASHWKNCQPLA